MRSRGRAPNHSPETWMGGGSGPGGSPSMLQKELTDKVLKPALITFDPFTFAYHGIVTRTDLLESLVS